ncbi:YybH family protein [Methylomagnum sp.]
MKRSLGLMLALVTTAAAAEPQGDAAVRRIAELSAAQWNAAFAKGRVDEILSLYEDNAMLVQPNGSVSKGSGQIRAFWQPLIQKGDYEMDIVDVRSDRDDTIVAIAELSDVKKLSSLRHQVMKYRYGGVLYSVLKRQPDGSWKAKVQKWNDEVKS